MDFLVFGRIGLSFRPGLLVHLGEVVLGDLPRVPKVNAPTLKHPQHPSSITFLEPVVEFTTNGWYQAQVSAPDPDAAEAIVCKDVEPALRTALSMVVGTPVVVQLHSVQQLGDDGDWSPRAGGTLRIAPSYSFTPQDLQRAFKAVQSRKTATGVLEHLRRAHALLLIGGPRTSDLLLEAQLLEYAKAIELMASDERFKDEVEDQLDRAGRRVEIINNLQSQLNKHPSDTKAARAINSASDQLKRLDNSFRGLRVSRMADALQLGDAWEREASVLGRARDRHLAHPGAPLDTEARRLLLGDGRGTQGAWGLVMSCLAALVSIELAEPLTSPPSASDVAVIPSAFTSHAEGSY